MHLTIVNDTPYLKSIFIDTFVNDTISCLSLLIHVCNRLHFSKKIYSFISFQIYGSYSVPTFSIFAKNRQDVKHQQGVIQPLWLSLASKTSLRKIWNYRHSTHTTNFLANSLDWRFEGFRINCSSRTPSFRSKVALAKSVWERTFLIASSHYFNTVRHVAEGKKNTTNAWDAPKFRSGNLRLWTRIKLFRTCMYPREATQRDSLFLSLCSLQW